MKRLKKGVFLYVVLTAIMVICCSQACAESEETQKENSSESTKLSDSRNDTSKLDSLKGSESNTDNRLGDHSRESSEEEFAAPWENQDILGIQYAESAINDAIPIDTTDLFTYKTMATVALSEVNSPDSVEFPYQSDCIKYNTWVYGYRVCNKFSNGVYEQKYNWNTAFVSWCADTLGLIEFGRFPKSTDALEMRRWFIDHDAFEFTKCELTSPCPSVYPEADDLLFYVAGDSYRVAIVVSSEAGVITFVEGDTDCGVKEFQVPIFSMPDSMSIIRWKKSNDCLLPYMSYLYQEVGFTPAAAIGVLVNIMYESEFNPRAIGDDGTSFGLCQWHRARWENLVNVCTMAGQNWASPEGQLFFLKYEMEQYPVLKAQMNEQPNTPSGAYAAASLFCVTYECPEGAEEAGAFRGAIAEYTFFPALLCI